MAHIVMIQDYDTTLHSTFLRFAQIETRIFPFNKTRQVVHWIAYADTLPNFGPETLIVDISSNNDVQEGWFYASDTGIFTNNATTWKDMYSDDELLIFIRKDRDARLAHTDYKVLRHMEQIAAGVGGTSITNDEYVLLLAYRQALRDFPSQCQNVRSPVWPQVPASSLPPVQG
jgi:hypothetical protein